MLNIRKSLSFVSLAMISAVIFFSSSSPAHSAVETVDVRSAVRPTCSAATLRGQFAYKGDGLVPGGPPPSPMVPFGVIGMMSFDGVGNLTIASTASNNGMIQSGLRSGYYSVYDDCTGSLQVILPFPPFEINHSLVIFEKGNSFYLIVSDPFSVVTIEAKRVR